ncbi:DUF1330 domain-containing protein [Catenuloplanes japonicus]|nr:DUF1330 domain-containing protein [Catenuloplanes japonicus]
MRPADTGPAPDRFWGSDEYKPLKELRRKHSTVKAIVVDGIS